MRRGFTLAEVLVCIAIIALIAGLSFPALRSALNDSKRSACASQLRQLGIATLMYMDDTGGTPRTIETSYLSDLGYARDRRIFLCPADTHRGKYSAVLTCRGYPEPSVAQSYFSPFEKTNFLWSLLKRADPNPGLFACLEHGAFTSRFRTTKDCAHLVFMRSGPILRLRLDGSVVSRPFSVLPEPSDPSSVREHFSYVKLFTDEKVTPDPLDTGS